MAETITTSAAFMDLKKGYDRVDKQKTLSEELMRIYGVGKDGYWELLELFMMTVSQGWK